jgi:uncharacterized protein (DUF433 family)
MGSLYMESLPSVTMHFVTEKEADAVTALPDTSMRGTRGVGSRPELTDAVTALPDTSMRVPLRQDETGAIRVGQTRVLLDLVVQAHQDGDTPEEIASRFESLRLADVYAVIGYYLSHREVVDEYLSRHEEAAAEVIRKIKAAQAPRPGFRAELEDRIRGENGRAPAAE